MGYLPEMWRDFGVAVAGLVGGVINAWLFLVRMPARSARDGADSSP
jgi:hypothetical protein